MATPLAIRIGDRSVELFLGGIPGDLPRHARERYRGFLPDANPGPAGPNSFRLTLRVDPERRPADWHPVHVANPPLVAEGALDRARVRGEGFEVDFDWERERGEGTIPDSLAHLDLALRVALGGMLLRDGSTFLHAAGAILDGFAVAFSGPSGAGKSTIAALCREAGFPVLADEMLVTLTGPLACRFRGTPFWDGRDQDGPAGGIFLLEHGPEPAVRHLPADRALPRLLAAGGCPLDLPAFQEAFFSAVANLLRRCPTYRLAFRPDGSFLPAIRALPEFAFFVPRRATPRPPASPGGDR